MKKKYIVSLTVIGIMFLFVLTIGTGYGLWIATQSNPEKSATTLNCFKIYYSTGNDIIEMRNINPVVNEEGIESSPYTLTITNICEDEKELQIRLNILEDNNVDIDSLTIQAAGNIEKNTILYKNLSNTKTIEENVSQSKMIGLVTVKPEETIRTNVKIWFDERKAPSITKDQIFKAKFEVIDTGSTIKATFAESLLNNVSAIEEKKAPLFNTTSFQSEGLYVANTSDGKTYYYRGVVSNNYVRFANHTWRIVRVNPDNTIRLILDKSAGYKQYSSKSNAIDYTGIQYIYNNEMIDNEVNTFLKDWYNQNIVNRELDKYVAKSSYCNDSSHVIENNHTYFTGYSRIVNKKSPSLVCPKTNTDFGGQYESKIGLITVDEVVMAGGSYNVNNLNYYLYNGENFFTSTPAEYYNFHSSLFSVNNSGAINTTSPDTESGIRPVINLISTLTVSGSGTVTDPYTIDISE